MQWLWKYCKRDYLVNAECMWPEAHFFTPQSCSLLKVEVFWEGHKIWKIFLLVKTKGEIFFKFCGRQRNPKCKNWRNISLAFDINVPSNVKTKWEIFFQILWLSQKTSTLRLQKLKKISHLVLSFLFPVMSKPSGRSFQILWPSHNKLTLFQVILEKTIRIPRSLSVKAASILKGFLNKNPADRLGCNRESGFMEIMTHPFFKTIEWEGVSLQHYYGVKSFFEVAFLFLSTCVFTVNDSFFWLR